jgi:hypothetical protein
MKFAFVVIPVTSCHRVKYFVTFLICLAVLISALALQFVLTFMLPVFT